MKKIRLYKITYPFLALLLIATTLWSASIMGAYASTDETAGAVPVCGVVEHTHMEGCYAQTKTLTCTLEEDDTHIHEGTCYEYENTLVCTQVAAEAHTHDDTCYTTESTVSCGKEETTGHIHGDGCYETVFTLTCGKEDHVHDASCQTTEQKLTCQQTEGEAHSHDTSCYTEKKILTCGREETTGHTHGEDCYQLQATTLLCTIHIHSEDCYNAETQLTCTLAEHTHSEDCYESAAKICEHCGVELVENAVHAKGCQTYCSCTPVDDVHAANCMIFCTCEQEKGVHQSGCALYKETTIQSPYGVTVFGALPETAELAVKPLAAADLTRLALAANESLAFAYDISIIVDGEEYQPAGEVTVTVNLPDGYRDLCDVTCASELIDVLTLYHLHSSSVESVAFFADDEADTLTFVVSGFSEFAAVVTESDPWGSVTIGSSVYIINSRVTLVDANLALLENEAMGTHEDAVSDAEISAVFGVNNEYAFSGFDEVYGAIYELLLENATKNLAGGSEVTAAGISNTEIWNINGDIKITGVQTLSSNDRLIIVSENSSATLILRSGGSSFSLAHLSATLSIQGCTRSTPVCIKGDGGTLKAFAIQNNGGSLYLHNTDISSFAVASGDNYAIIGFGSKNDIARYMYMSHSAMHDISGASSPGIFCRAYITSSNTNNKKSRLWLYDNDFYNCVSTGSGSTRGGAVIRSYAADNCQLRAEMCRFTNNQAKVNSADASGGGAIYWKSAAGSAEFENCTFTNNKTNSVGGAIYNTGTMTINKCTFVGNYAKLGGGAIAAEPPRTNTHYASIDTQNLSGSLTLDAQTLLQGNATDAYGGGIYFYGIKGTNGTDAEKNAEDIVTYDMFLTIDGATITGNTARDGGGVAMKLEHGAYQYETGIVINPGSTIANNTATQNGGAIWMYAAANCDVTKSEGIIMSGGKACDNSAGQYGGTVYMSSASSAVNDMNFLMAGGTLENSAASDGGAIYMNDGIFTMSDGLISTGKATGSGGGVYMVAGTFAMSGGEIQDCTAPDLGGAIYLGGGDMIVSGGSITESTAAYGGGAYLGGGDMIVSGGSITENIATYGGGTYVSGGELNISGGSISNNTASGNGGGAYVENGTVTMSGGTVDNNKATNGSGGGVYVSANDYNASVIIYSGSVSGNSAGTSGGAVAVVGTAGGDETIAVTLGVNEDHSTMPFLHPNTETGPYQHKSCPVIENNTSTISGGAIYITGGSSTKLNIYCLLEQNNQVGDGDSLSNCMMVEGGTVKISSSDPDTGLGSDHGKTEINGTVHVLGGDVFLGGGGDVTLSGATSNPKFNSAITVDVVEAGGSFTDNRISDTHYKVLYFENFFAPGAATATGQYTAYQFLKGKSITISGSIYSHPGYTILGWCTTDTIDGNGMWYDVGSTYPKEGDPYDDLTIYAIWKMNGYTVKFHPNVPSGEPYTGVMDPQQFTYNVEDTLIPNKFEYLGYIFNGWLGSNGNMYADGADIFNLTTKDGAIIDFYAMWTRCLHNGEQDLNGDNIPDTVLVYSADGNTLTRECTCGGQTLTAILTAEDAIYDKSTHGAEVYFSDGTAWPVSLFYNGKTYAEVEYTSTNAPDQAGEYAATLTATEDTATLKAAVTVNFTIAKADQDPPSQKPSFTAESTESNGDIVTVLKVEAVPESSVETEAEYRLAYYNGDKWEFTGWTKADEINDDYACIIQLEFALVNYYVEARYAENANYKASPTIRGEQVFFYKGTVKIHVECDPGITAVLSDYTDPNTGDSGGVTVVASYDSINYYLLTGDFQVTATTYDVGADGSKTLSETQANLKCNDTGLYLLSNIPDNCEILVKITGTKLKAQATSTVAEKQVFGIVIHDSDPVISNDSAFTAHFSVSSYDSEIYCDMQLDFTDGSSENNAKLLPAGTTIILLNQADGSYWSYIAPAGGAASVPLTSFTRMGGSEKFSVSGTNLLYQFIVDFSRVSGGCNGTGVEMTLSANKTRTNAPNLSATVSVTLADQSSFAIEKESADSGLTQTFKLKYSASDGAASKWDNRKTALVLTPAGAIPADASLLVTLEDGQRVNWPMSGNGSYIIPLSVVGSETLTVELVSSLFPKEGMTYTFKVQWIVSNSASAKAPMNGHEGAHVETVDFKKAETVQHGMKVVGSTRLLPISSTEPLKVTVTYQIPSGAAGYTVTAELLRKGDAGEYVSTAWNRTITSSGHELEVSLAGLGLPPGSYCLMVTMAADSGASTILQLPYYFIAE